MDENFFCHMMRRQQQYYENLMQEQLKAEAGVHEAGGYGLLRGRTYEECRKYYLMEIKNWDSQGARITLNERDLMPQEFAAAAGLLAAGQLSRQIRSNGQFNCTEYRLVPID